MMIFSDEHYAEIAGEIIRQIDSAETLNYGVVELCYGKFEFILGFEFSGRILRRYAEIAFFCGTRCSTNFDMEILKQWM